MDDEYDHLLPATRELLRRSDAERIRETLRPYWIPYSRVAKMLELLEDRLAYPPMARSPGLLITGSPNAGKTELALHFASLHPPVDNPSSEARKMPVVYIEAPDTPSEAKLYTTILSRFWPDTKTSSRTEQRQYEVVTQLRAVGTRLLLIDEIHTCLRGSTKRSNEFLNTLKWLSNQLAIPIVLLGTPVAYNAISTDEQLLSRFEPITLKPFQASDSEYRRVLKTFEGLLPLKKPSNLAEESLSLKIRSMTNGTIGETKKVLATAAIWAIKTRKEYIDHIVLDKIPPIPRRRT